MHGKCGCKFFDRVLASQEDYMLDGGLQVLGMLARDPIDPTRGFTIL